MILFSKPKGDKEQCDHNYPKRADYWLKWRCCGCGALKWYWTFKHKNN